MHFKRFLGWVFNVLVCIVKLLNVMYYFTTHGSSPFPCVNLHETLDNTGRIFKFSSSNISVQYNVFILPLAQNEKDLASTRAEDLQRQLNELYKDHESLRKTNEQAVQGKVCNRHAIGACTIMMT